LLSPAKDDLWLTRTANTIRWRLTGDNGPIAITLEYSTLRNNETWSHIANGTNISSLTWITPDTPDIYYIRAVVTDSANPSQVATTVGSIEVRERLQNSDLSLTIIVVAHLPMIALLASLVKRRKIKVGQQKHGSSQGLKLAG